MVILALAAWFFRYGAWPFFGDTSTYLQGAQGLAEGHGYRLISYAAEPPIGLYPPLHSALLSLFWKIQPDFPANFGLLWSVVATLVLACSWTFLAILRRAGMPLGLGALIVLNWGLAPRCLQMSSWLFSDPDFILLCFGLLLWLRADAPWPWPVRRWWILSVVLVITFFVRSAALGLIGAFGLLSLLELRRREWRPTLAITSGFVACVLLKKLQAKSQGPDYGSVFQALFLQLGGLEGYLKVVGQHTWTALSGAPLWEQFSFLGYYVPKSAGYHAGPAVELGVSALGTVAFWGLLILATLGWRRQTGQWKYGALFCGLVYAAQPIVMPWDSENFGRYLNILQPLFWIWVWQGARSLPWDLRWKRMAEFAVAFLLLANAVGNLAGNVVERKHWRNFFSLDDLQEVADWTRTNTPPETHIGIDYRLPAFYFQRWLGRPLVTDYFNPHRMESPITREAQGNLEADYMVTSPRAYGAYEPPESFHLIHTSPAGQFRVYSITRTEPIKRP